MKETFRCFDRTEKLFDYNIPIETAGSSWCNVTFSLPSSALMFSCYIPLSVCIGHCTSWTLKLATKARERSLGSMHPSFNIVQQLREGLQDILPADAHILCNNKLHVSMTRVRDGKNVVVKQFNTRDDLIQVGVCKDFGTRSSGFIFRI